MSDVFLDICEACPCQALADLSLQPEPTPRDALCELRELGSAGEAMRGFAVRCTMQDRTWFKSAVGN